MNLRAATVVLTGATGGIGRATALLLAGRGRTPLRYGRRWRRHAPADLVWMLRIGVAVDEPRVRVHALVSDEDPVEPQFRASAMGAASGSVGQHAPVRPTAHPMP